MLNADLSYLLTIVGIGLIVVEILIGVHKKITYLMLSIFLMLGGFVGIAVDSFTWAIAAVIIFTATYFLFGRKHFETKITHVVSTPKPRTTRRKSR